MYNHESFGSVWTFKNHARCLQQKVHNSAEALPNYETRYTNKIYLEYNFDFPTNEKTGRKPCSIREQIIGIAVVSKRDFDNVTCDLEL